ncbi:MAG: YihY/virulence factor BrkB family protein [Hyphomicrobiales bacterium]|nr:YihY/virulence factor BrkB family protein [Hyphomicrobiales bacterium]
MSEAPPVPENVVRSPLVATAGILALVVLGLARPREEIVEKAGDPKIHEEGRGRAASTPSEIPKEGWKDVFWRVYQNVPEHRIVSIAAGVAFYVLLAIFPGIAALVALYGLFADPSTISRHLNDLSGVLPGGATDVIGEQLGRLTAQPNSTLGFAFLVGLGVSLWSANAGMKALVDALNIVYGEKEKRSFIKLNAASLVFTLGAIIFMILALGAIAVLPFLIDDLGLASATEWLVRLGKWPVLFILVALIIAVIYRYGPSRERAQWRWISWGSAFAAFAWLIMSILFSWYAAKFGTYNKTYGSLGAAIGFMTWIWLSSIVILLGAELDAEMEHQTARDTTTGPPQPMGKRGAWVADTIGEASN